VLVASLERVDDAKNFSSVAASGGRIREDGADSLLGVDDEDRSDRERDTFRVDIGGVLLVQHVVQQGNLPLLVTDDGELQVATADLVDISDPVSMAVNGVCGQSDQFDASSCEFWLQLCECSQLSCANWCEVFGVGEEDDPFIADELMEVN